MNQESGSVGAPDRTQGSADIDGAKASNMSEERAPASGEGALEEEAVNAPHSVHSAGSKIESFPNLPSTAESK